MTAHRLSTRLLSALAVAVSPAAQAALTGIADEPLITQSEFKPKPNLMVILDDSQSMNFQMMPDDMRSLLDSQPDMRSNNFTGGIFRLGFKAIQCNGVAYNPGYTYTPPKYANGTDYPNAAFNAAPFDGFLNTASLAASDPRKTSLDLRTTVLNMVMDGDNNPSTLTIRTTDSMKRKSDNDEGTGSVAYFKVRTDTAIKPSDLTLNTSKVLTVSTLMSAALGPKSFVVGDSITFQSNAANENNSFKGTITAWAWNTGQITITVSAKTGSTSKSEWYVSFPGQTYYTYKGSVPVASRKWTYDSAGNAITTTDFYKECTASETAASRASNTGVFELNTISANSSADEQTNYANWHAYYRNRKLMMRTAMGRALNNLDEGYRLGFMNIHQKTNSEFWPVDDFNDTNKQGFYALLYGGTEEGGTPLRSALSEAGRYFAGKLVSNGKPDPMQYACQRNFALLTTDGYWTTPTGENAFNLSNTALGNADGGAGSPYEDAHSNTLADVAYYYYSTDLRTGTAGSAACTGAPVGGNAGQDVCANIVSPSGQDTATHQHMTTYTIGMGVNGTKDPASDTPGSFAWPAPTANKSTTVDDLWHAAINGRGAYYSAQNATELTRAIEGMVSAVQDVSGAGSATATSTLDLVQGDGNIAFEASYTTGSWFGDVLARTLNSSTAQPEGAPQWSAREKLNAKEAASRAIYFKNGNALSAFTLGNLTAAGLDGYFKSKCATGALSQCTSLGDTHKGIINAGEALVTYLRGDSSKDTTNTAEPLFRKRLNKLGDIINSKPIHVGKPPFDYADEGYAAFKASHASRKKVVYVGANDGMLHALDAATGEELWAYIPTAVMPYLHKLADVKYGSAVAHQYYVDGKTVQGDVKIDGQWKTILVGGLNKGGRAYYALDITDPDEPKALWEFTDDNLGLTYSDPVITKLAGGTWAVAFGAGYNNAPEGNTGSGDGKGRLFVVNAANGAILRNIPTTAGDTTTPAGMAKINVWVKALSDNTAQRFYAGDLLGNVWRFNLEGSGSAMLLAQMKDASGTPQPITTEPKLREYDKQPVVVVATGRYLGRDDINDTQVQSIAAIRDPLTATGWGVVRTNTAKFKKVTITKSGTTASGAAVTVDWATDGGWWADFPTSGERVAMPMEWDGARLLAATTLPSGDQCKSGGASWLYSFGLAGGKTDAEQFSEDTLIVGFSVVTNDEGQPKILVRTSGNETQVKDGTGLGGGTTIKRARRVSWRELP